MKDPSCGPIGVLSLIIFCLIKWSAIYVLMEQQHYSALILFPILGRLAPLFLFLTTQYVREKGLGSSIAEFIPKTVAVMVFALCLLASVYFSLAGIFTAMVFMMTLVYLRRKFMQRIGGITGDTVGASIEICETVSVFSFVLLSFYLPISWI